MEFDLESQTSVSQSEAEPAQFFFTRWRGLSVGRQQLAIIYHHAHPLPPPCSVCARSDRGVKGHDLRVTRASWVESINGRSPNIDTISFRVGEIVSAASGREGERER